MTKFLKRFFLCFFSLFACLFLTSLLLSVPAFAHTTGLFIPESSEGNFSVLVTLADTPTPTPPITPIPTMTVVPSPTPTTVPTPMPTPTTVPTPTPSPTMEPPTPTPTIVPSPTATIVPTPLPTPTPPIGNNTSTNNAPGALNALIFTMGGIGVIMVIVGVILYFVYSRPI